MEHLWTSCIFNGDGNYNYVHTEEKTKLAEWEFFITTEDLIALFRTNPCGHPIKLFFVM